MQFFVTKSGLEIFDTARAYGLAQLVDLFTPQAVAPTISDTGGCFVIEVSKPLTFQGLPRGRWEALFDDSVKGWQKVFTTYLAKWASERTRVKRTIEEDPKKIIGHFESPDQEVLLHHGEESIPGGLDPSGFKGLRGLTAGNYTEAPRTYVSKADWSVGALGAALCLLYKDQPMGAGVWEHYAFAPTPELVEFRDYREIQSLADTKQIRFIGLRHAAAYVALKLVEAVRQRLVDNSEFRARFSYLHFFSLFGAGRQSKPSRGGTIALSRLLSLAREQPAVTGEMFETWIYLLTRGGIKGQEDLGIAASELVMAPSLDTYYRHARIFNRYIVDRNKGIKRENLYTERALEEVMHYVQ
jgi:hypothetical protein